MKTYVIFLEYFSLKYLEFVKLYQSNSVTTWDFLRLTVLTEGVL